MKALVLTLLATSLALGVFPSAWGQATQWRLEPFYDDDYPRMSIAPGDGTWTVWYLSPATGWAQVNTPLYSGGNSYIVHWSRVYAVPEYDAALIAVDGERAVGFFCNITKRDSPQFYIGPETANLPGGMRLFYGGCAEDVDANGRVLVGNAYGVWIIDPMSLQTLFHTAGTTRVPYPVAFYPGGRIVVRMSEFGEVGDTWRQGYLYDPANDSYERLPDRFWPYETAEDDVIGLMPDECGCYTVHVRATKSSEGVAKSAAKLGI